MNCPFAPIAALGVAGFLAGCAAAAPPSLDAHGHSVAPGTAAPLVPADPITAEVARSLGVEASRVELTLDPALQAIAREEVERSAAELHAASAVALILEPSTGAVLAMAGRDGDHDAPLLAAERSWITGSTLKTILLAAALEEGVVTPQQRFSCGNGQRAYGDKTLHDARPFDTLDVPEILATSSNVCSSRVYDALGLTRTTAWFRKMHFGEILPLQISHAASNVIPTLTDELSFDAALFATGELMALSPLHVASAYAAIANEGIYVAPTLVRRAGGSDGHGKPPERVMRAETARTMVRLLEGVVYNELGTGAGARVEHVRVAGKTGTASWIDAGREHNYASFVGFVPSERPRFVVLIGLAAPGDQLTGGKSAAPAFARIATRALAR